MAEKSISELETEISNLDREIDEYADRNENAANPISSNVLNRMIDRKTGLEVALVRAKIRKIDESLKILGDEKNALTQALMKLTKIAILIVLFSSNSMAESKKLYDAYECVGQNWIYFYEFQQTASGEECFTGSIRKSEATPNPKTPWEKYKKNKREKVDLTECWRSMARIQTDGAKCCFLNSDGKYYEAGMPTCTQSEKP